MLTKLQIQDVRVFHSFVLEPSSSLTLIIAPNARGKSTILEAIRLLSVGKSFRAGETAELIAFGAEFGRVEGWVREQSTSVGGGSKNDGVVEEKNAVLYEEENIPLLHLDCLLTPGVLQGQRSLPKYFSINGTRRQRKSILGKLPTVLFQPDDMALIEGSPERRRSYLDECLVQTHPHYATDLSTYTNALLRRNKTLQQVREHEVDRRALLFWDKLIIEHGEKIQKQRQEFVATMTAVAFPEKIKATYVPSLISTELLGERSEREIAAGHTLIGPHKDEVQVEFVPVLQDEWRSLVTYGSRGQQRMGVVWLKMVEAAWLRQHLGIEPLLLFDDVYSELDEHHRALVERLMQGRQSIVTFVTERQAEELGLGGADKVVTLDS